MVIKIIKINRMRFNRKNIMTDNNIKKNKHLYHIRYKRKLHSLKMKTSRSRSNNNKNNNKTSNNKNHSNNFHNNKTKANLIINHNNYNHPKSN